MRAIRSAHGVRADLCMFGLAACDEGRPGFVNASVRTVTNTRQVGMRMQSKNAQARINTFVLVRTAQAREWNKQEHGYIKFPSNREDQQKLEMREQKKKSKDAKRIRGIVHENDKTKEQVTCKIKWEILMHHDEQELLSLRARLVLGPGGWTPSCAPRQDVRRWITFVVTRCTRVARKTVKAPIKTGWTETDKRQPGKPNVRTRMVAQEF